MTDLVHRIAVKRETRIRVATLAASEDMTQDEAINMLLDLWEKRSKPEKKTATAQADLRPSAD